MARRGVPLRSRDDRGFTLVELLVTLTIFSVLMALLIGLFVQLTYQGADVLAQQRAVQQARLGLSQIDRQIRSGNLILDPAAEDPDDSGVPAYYSLRIYTQEGGVATCAQWRVVFLSGTEFGDLQYREWPPAAPSTVTAWTTVADNLVAPTPGFDESDASTTANEQMWPPFWVDTAGGVSEAQNVRITLRLSDPSSRDDARAQTLTSVVTGRNTVFGYSDTNCSNVPAP